MIINSQPPVFFRMHLPSGLLLFRQKRKKESGLLLRASCVGGKRRHSYYVSFLCHDEVPRRCTTRIPETETVTYAGNLSRPFLATYPWLSSSSVTATLKPAR